MSPPLLLLHLSDLHFGHHSRFRGQDLPRVARLLVQTVAGARSAVGAGEDERVALVLVTGDIAEAARRAEYEQARAFFDALAGALGLPRRCFVFVPGNHDVSWAETKKVSIEQDDEGFDDIERDRRIQDVKLRRYNDFVKAFYAGDDQQILQPLGHGAAVHSLPERRLAVAALNSCERESHLHQGGHLSEAQAQALMNHWRAGEVEGWLKIVAIHHNPVAIVPAGVASWVDYLKSHKERIKDETLSHFVADAFGFSGWERLRNLAEDCHVQIVLHGHHHAHDLDPWAWRRGRKGQTLVLSAGSWGLVPDKLPEGQPAMAHLLRLDLDREEARSLLLIYEPRARADGEVEPGKFVIDPVRPEGVPLHISLPEGWQRGGAEPPRQGDRGAAALLRDFATAYRATLARTYERWDLGGVGAVQPGGAGRPVEARLDDMYLPLRLAKDLDPEKLDAGRAIGPDDLLAREAPLVIRGPAGSGKTTWMRWTYRRLLEREDALPFTIELRKLAADWSRMQPRGSERTLEAYLESWIAESGLAGWERAVTDALASATGPRPVLLVDGWDELGNLGNDLREKLQQLLSRCPRALAVVSSRPYGESRPSRSEGFEVLDIQPLADEEISTFAHHFQARVHGEDETAARVSVERFISALETSSEAKALARTALLLTMMLIISRDRPLPDRRHRLYEESAGRRARACAGRIEPPVAGWEHRLDAAPPVAGTSGGGWDATADSRLRGSKRASAPIRQEDALSAVGGSGARAEFGAGFGAIFGVGLGAGSGAALGAGLGAIRGAIFGAIFGTELGAIFVAIFVAGLGASVGARSGARVGAKSGARVGSGFDAGLGARVGAGLGAGLGPARRACSCD